MARSTRLATLVMSLALVAGCGGADSAADDSQASTGGASASSGDSPTAAQAPVELSVPTVASGRCMAPSVENLRAQDTAFEGTVTEVRDGVAVLEVDTMYAGDPVDTVSVTLAPHEVTELLVVADFEAGGTYLVSSLDGQVSVCGLSGPKDDLLAGLYQEAFGG